MLLLPGCLRNGTSEVFPRLSTLLYENSLVCFTTLTRDASAARPAVARPAAAAIAASAVDAAAVAATAVTAAAVATSAGRRLR